MASVTDTDLALLIRLYATITTFNMLLLSEKKSPFGIILYACVCVCIYIQYLGSRIEMSEEL